MSNCGANTTPPIEKEIVEIILAAGKIFASEDIGAWLGQANPKLDGLSPWQVITIGNSDEVLALIESLTEGKS